MTGRHVAIPTMIDGLEEGTAAIATLFPSESLVRLSRNGKHATDTDEAAEQRRAYVLGEAVA